MELQFNTWNTILDLLIKDAKNHPQRNIFDNICGKTHYRLNVKRKSFSVISDIQSITIRKQRFINPIQRKIVKKLHLIRC